MKVVSDEKIRFWFEIDSSMESIVQSLAKEIGVEIKPMTARRWSRFGKPSGKGFGDKVWRVNYKMGSIEASFNKPCKESKSLKMNGFKWNHADGIWYAPNNNENAEVCFSLNLDQTEPVTV